jgi:DNA invertase Pin-like site-specific DNA recombinase
MKIGYARVSMTEDTLQEQLQSLHEAGCQDVVVDKVGEGLLQSSNLRDVCLLDFAAKPSL